MDAATMENREAAEDVLHEGVGPEKFFTSIARNPLKSLDPKKINVSKRKQFYFRLFTFSSLYLRLFA
jgi:hypothetical protein